jgi:hypothetical protein
VEVTRYNSINLLGLKTTWKIDKIVIWIFKKINLIFVLILRW